MVRILPGLASARPSGAETWVPATSVRPGTAPGEGEIVRVGERLARRRLGFGELIRNAVARAIGDRLLARFEAQPQLLLHVARRGPAHQRLNRARLLGLIIEHPILGLGVAG